MIAGLLLVLALRFYRLDPFFGLNAGFVALAVNFMIAILVSWLNPAAKSKPIPAS